MRISQIVCDECGAERAAGNKWFSVTGARMPVFVRFSVRTKRHICSEACAHTMLSKYLTVLRQQMDSGM